MYTIFSKRHAYNVSAIKSSLITCEAKTEIDAEEEFRRIAKCLGPNTEYMCLYHVPDIETGESHLLMTWEPCGITTRKDA